MRRVYALAGAPDAVANEHYPAERHDYGPSKRTVAVAFLVKHLGLTGGSIDPANPRDESRVTIESREALLVFDGEHPWPAHALKSPEEVRAAFAAR